ncbi:MAG: DUF1015 domain-containing protein [Thermodesulfobacteriota bacterium]
MADIRPFRGVLYNAEKVGDLAGVMAPPYDVISPARQDELYDRHPNNVVRLILGRTGDGPGGDRYSRAAEALKEWTASGVLARDPVPAIYYYTQTYPVGGRKALTRKGFIALARLEDFGEGGVHPHEKTLSGPKADRLRLMQACGSNFSCIFSLYSEPELRINRLLDEASRAVEPIIDVTDDDGIVDLVWRIDDPVVLSDVRKIMEGKSLFIADGHHRYETALNYRNSMREANPEAGPDAPFEFCMMYFSNMDDQGMTIWPTHRVIHSLAGFDPEGFLAEVSEYFDVLYFPYTAATEAEARDRMLTGKQAAEGGDRSAFGLHIRGRDVYYLLTLKGPETMDRVFGDSIPEVFKDLDVTVLHSLIFDRILGITQEAQEKQTNLVYVKSYDDALKAMHDETNQLVFLLNATRIEQVKAVAESGEVMPQKSTYFYPKLLSGVVLNVHDGAEAAPA